MLEDTVRADTLIEFTAADRCDGCAAQAYTMAKRDDVPSELLFCLHHAKRYRQALKDEGWTIVDDTAALKELSPQYAAPV